MDAHFKMETVEHFARIALVAQQLGGTKTLNQDQVQELLDLRANFGIAGRPSCSLNGAATPAADGDLVEEITREVVRRLQAG
jgi:L-fuculose-phosphate aldolase